MAFYKFGKAFLISVKDISNLDSAFLADLWSKYKSKMLIYAETNLPKTGLTATEYMEAIKHNRKVASSEDLEHPEIVIHPGTSSMSAPDTRLRQIVIQSNPYGTTNYNPRFKESLTPLETVSYTHLTLPTILRV